MLKWYNVSGTTAKGNNAGMNVQAVGSIEAALIVQNELPVQFVTLSVTELDKDATVNNPIPSIAIEVSEGRVQNVYANVDVSVEVYDLDTQDPDELDAIQSELEAYKADSTYKEVY